MPSMLSMQHGVSCFFSNFNFDTHTQYVKYLFAPFKDYLSYIAVHKFDEKSLSIKKYIKIVTAEAFRRRDSTLSTALIGSELAEAQEYIHTNSFAFYKVFNKELLHVTKKDWAIAFSVLHMQLAKAINDVDNHSIAR